jgi:hypothetical protein
MQSKNPSMKSLITSAFLVMLATAPHLSASSILIDFGNNGTNGSQITSPDTNGNYWNNSSSAGFTVSNLMTTTNAPTVFDLAYTTSVATNSAALGVASAPGSFNISNAYEDAIFTTGTSLGTGITLRLSQLDATKTYIFTLFGSRDATGSRTTNFSITGGSTVTGTLQTSGTDLGGSGVNHNNSTTLVLGGLGGISPDGSNQIDVTFFATSTDTNKFAYLNALEITVIPEPSSAMLLCGIGTLLLLRRRRA